MPSRSVSCHRRAMQPEESLERWFTDFAICAQILPRPDASMDLIASLLPSDEREDEAARFARARRVCNAYRYASENAAAFEALGEFDRTSASKGHLSLRVVYALYLFFGSGDYDEADPSLDEVLETLVAASPDSDEPMRE